MPDGREFMEYFPHHPKIMKSPDDFPLPRVGNFLTPFAPFGRKLTNEDPGDSTCGGLQESPVLNQGGKPQYP
jgi:hypothetical protein